MVNVSVLEELINSMDEAVKRLQGAVNSNDLNYVNQLRVFIFDVQKKIDTVLNG